MLTRFNPANWYWFVGSDQTRVYSSARNTYVDAGTDQDYLAWKASNWTVTIEDEPTLWQSYMKDVLPATAFNGETFSQPAVGEYTKPQLQSYSEEARVKKENGGIVVDGVPVRTDTAGVQNAYLASSAQTQPTRWVGGDGKVYKIKAVQPILDGITSNFTRCVETYADLQPKIESGEVTTPQQIDDAFNW
jgi:hypothetical protein